MSVLYGICALLIVSWGIIVAFKRPQKLISRFQITFLFFLGSYNTQAQVIADFDQWKIITIHESEVAGASDLNDFPFLFSITDSELATIANGGFLTHPNGYEILFTNADGTQILDHQIERYDSFTGTIVAWVRTDISATMDTKLRIYFGDASISTDGSSATVWDSNYKGVWHLSTDASE